MAKLEWNIQINGGALWKTLLLHNMVLICPNLTQVLVIQMLGRELLNVGLLSNGVEDGALAMELVLIFGLISTLGVNLSKQRPCV